MRIFWRILYGLRKRDGIYQAIKGEYIKAVGIPLVRAITLNPRDNIAKLRAYLKAFDYTPTEVCAMRSMLHEEIQLVQYRIDRVRGSNAQMRLGNLCVVRFALNDMLKILERY